MKTIGFHGWGRQKDAIADLPLWGANRIVAASFVSWWPQYATGILHLDGFESCLHQKENHHRKVVLHLRETTGLDGRFAPLGANRIDATSF